MKKLIVLFLSIFCSVLSAKEVTVSVGAGENWKQNRAPQFAIWLEDSAGNFVRTLYVTKKAGKQNWIFAPKSGRPESLPVWYYSIASEIKDKNAQSTHEESFDAVTSATPKGGIVFDISIDDDSDYVIKAEFNKSFDYNDFYKKENSGVNGQPSVVYSARIPANFSKNSGEIKLDFAGLGSLDGTDGIIHIDTAHLTTAKSIVKLVAIKGK